MGPEVHKVEGGRLREGRRDVLAMSAQRNMGLNERYPSWGGLDRERHLAARTRKIPRANTPIPEGVQHTFRPTVGAGVMSGEARKDVDNRTPFQFEQFILALQCIQGSNTTPRSSNRCRIHAEALSPPMVSFIRKVLVNRVKCIHYHRGWVNGAWSTSHTQLSMRAVKPRPCWSTTPVRGVRLCHENDSRIDISAWPSVLCIQNTLLLPLALTRGLAPWHP